MVPYNRPAGSHGGIKGCPPLQDVNYITARGPEVMKEIEKKTTAVNRAIASAERARLLLASIHTVL